MSPRSGTRTSVAERRETAQAALEQAIQQLVESGEYGAWFAKMASFHRYSPTNTMWILAQAPRATRVASYRTWKQLERHVRKGERGIMVFHPKPYWIDPATGERTRPPRTADQRARLEQRTAFGVGYVFDVTQTEGQPLPQLSRPAPEQAPRELADHLDDWCAKQGLTVETRRLPQGLSGYYERTRDRTVLADGLSGGERAATLAHELAHREDPELLRAEVVGDRRYYAHHRADCEAVAEGVAHMVSARFGHDITDHSAGYIAGWIRGDTDRFKALQQRVGQVARTLLPPDRLDRALTAAHERAVALDTSRRRGAGRRR